MLEREKKILARTYKDKLSAYRYRTVRDEETLESSLKEVEIYTDIACALNLSQKSAQEQTEVASKSVREYIVFTGPEVILQENDKVIVITKSGQRYEGRSAKSYVIESHSETVIKVERVE